MKLFYHKRSMTPTFVPGDLLTIVPYEGRTIRVGDVVVFPNQDDTGYVTHRVIKSTPEGVITRGDNVRNPVDPYLLRPEEIVGFVTSAERERRVRKVWGGPVGLAYHYTSRSVSGGDRLLRGAVRSAGRRLRFGSLLRRIDLGALLPKEQQPRILLMKRGDGVEQLLLFGKYMVGRWRGDQSWSIRVPFRILVNEAFLDSVGEDMDRYEAE